MKTFRLLLAFAFAALSFSAQAQIDYNDPQWAPWGETAADREANMLNNSFLKEALDNKDYNSAANYLQLMINNAPKASDSIYARGILLYRNKINRARSLKEKNMYIDSVLLLHDLRLEHFASHPQRGEVYILDSKARMAQTYRPSDRAALRKVFKEAIEAGGNNTKPDLVTIYFQNICDDYQMDEVMADAVLEEYENLSPYFEALTGTDVEFKDKFDSAFGASGAASCENLEAIFSKKLAETPEDVNLLRKAVGLMSRANCDSPFYVASAEKLYEFEPSSSAAMALASIFQNQGEFAKATKYLNDTLASEEDIEEREKLYSRIALVMLAAENFPEALKAASAAIATEDDTLSDNGVALFVRAQCYARSVAGCGDFACMAVYWAAFDAMNQAINNFSADEAAYLEPAKAMLNSYRSAFPSQEECFFNEVNEGSSYRITRGSASGVNTTVRYR